MGITAAIHTLGMLLIFVPFMALDARRTKVVIFVKLHHAWQMQPGFLVVLNGIIHCHYQL
jgi:hypothetical protein